MLNKDFIKRKLALNQQDLVHLRQFENLNVKELAKDAVVQAAVERYLERIITRAIDINQHIIAEKGDIAFKVGHYRDTFLRLADINVYPLEFAEKIAPSAGLRNILVHEYNNIDEELLTKSMSEAIKDFNDYAKYILAFIEKE